MNSMSGHTVISKAWVPDFELLGFLDVADT